MIKGQHYRPFQLQTLQALDRGEDVLVSAPTGSGKSLLYQGASVEFADLGCTVVLFPLKALVVDQERRCQELGLRYATIYGDTRGGDRFDALNAIADGNADLVLTTPETFDESIELQEALQRRGIYVIAVDEAHSVETWGSSFRPSYRRIGRIGNNLGARRYLMCSATLTAESGLAAARSVKRTRWSVIALEAVRPNLRYLSGNYGDQFGPILAKAVHDNDPAGPGVMFCTTVKAVEATARGAHSALGGSRMVLRYHGQMAQRERAYAQKTWMEGSHWIVATNAFGMGVDKADVRGVVHLQLPSSLVSYAQEAGRAGRDGKPAYCWLNATDPGRAAQFLTLQSYPDPGLIEQVWVWLREKAIETGQEWVPSSTTQIARELKTTQDTVRTIRGWLAGAGLIRQRRGRKKWEVLVSDRAEDLVSGLAQPDKKRELVRRLRKVGKRKRGSEFREASSEQVERALYDVYKSWRPQMERLIRCGAIEAAKPEQSSVLRIEKDQFEFDSHDLEQGRERAMSRLRAMREFRKLDPMARPGAITEAVGLEADRFRDLLVRHYPETAHVHVIGQDHGPAHAALFEPAGWEAGPERQGGGEASSATERQSNEQLAVTPSGPEPASPPPEPDEPEPLWDDDEPEAALQRCDRHGIEFERYCPRCLEEPVTAVPQWASLHLELRQNVDRVIECPRHQLEYQGYCPDCFDLAMDPPDPERPRSTIVVNLKVHEYDVYVGRPGQGESGYFGNPFTVEEHGERALELYAQYFVARIGSDREFAERVEELRGKKLGCFCAPAKCHGDVIARWLNNTAPEAEPEPVEDEAESLWDDDEEEEQPSTLGRDPIPGWDDMKPKPPANVALLVSMLAEAGLPHDGASPGGLYERTRCPICNAWPFYVSIHRWGPQGMEKIDRTEWSGSCSSCGHSGRLPGVLYRPGERMKTAPAGSTEARR